MTSRTLRIWTAALVLNLALGGAARASSAPDGTARRITSAMRDAAHIYLADRCRVGLSVAAHVAGRTVFGNYGSIRRQHVQPPTADTVYELASVTKTFIGALAAKAVVERRMALDGDFRTYLPGRYPNLLRDGRPITLRTLATHMSGLQRDLPDSDALLSKPDYDRLGDQLAALNQGFDRSRSLAALHGVTLRATPGEAFAYSNIGIRVIGYGLEQVYHMPLPQLLHSAILQPLRMTDTRFTLTPPMRRRLATPYSRNGHVQPLHDDSAGAAYGLYSTPRDMARYLAWQLKSGNPVIARSHALLHGTRDDGQGLIWNIGTDNGAPFLWHGGGTFGETSQMVLYPNDRIGFVLLANDACAGSEGALKRFAAAVRDAIRPTAP
ncbi:serine hydrolase domain-containing protein [Sphingomonas sp. ASY06-1R]|uniref:serine hydrolase domain-containing protein n=1 Tax=Sphingomonas sp. ASY06-1R TaxID=3445771 RepID=UPI003FA2367C